MIKRSFFALKKPCLKYEPFMADLPEPEIISSPKTVSLLFKLPYDQYDPKDTLLLGTGENVKTGQKLSLYGSSDDYVISPVSGTIASIASYTDDFDHSYTAVSIDVSENEEMDDQFHNCSKEPSLDTAMNFLAFAPGNPPINVFSDSDKLIHTIVVCGTDCDLLVTTNQYVLKSNIDLIKKGISILKKITGVDNIIVAAPKEMIQGYGSIGAEIKGVDVRYPSAFPKMMMKDIFGKVVPAGKSCEDMGVCFFNAEAVASIGAAFDDGRIPVTKMLTLVKKDGSKRLISVKIGTPISQIFTACDVTLQEKDRIIVGGLMTGSSVYSLDHPVQPDTDAIIVQEKEDISFVSDYPCINCGECVRICPVNIQVNMLVRFLDAGEFEEAADQCDLDSCIECGLCSFVCVSRMPVFQYIRLAKSELARIQTAEANNV